MLISFVLLALSICAVWLPSIPVGERRIPPWCVLFIAAIASGEAFGVLKPIGLVTLGLFSISAYLSRSEANNAVQRGIFSLLTFITSLALAMHLLPGFNNPLLISNVKFSADAAPFTQYLNFDKGAAGLLLLAYLCPRTNTLIAWREMFNRTWPVALITSVIVISTALMSGFIRMEYKVSSYTVTFLVTNLLFTCVAEEAFFRGLIQEKCAALIHHSRYGNMLAIAVSGILFGVAHASGGATYTLLATLTGLGCASAYAMTKRIEAPILTHFTLNMLHFVFFTYPHI